MGRGPFYSETIFDDEPLNVTSAALFLDLFRAFERISSCAKDPTRQPIDPFIVAFVRLKLCRTFLLRIFSDFRGRRRGARLVTPPGARRAGDRNGAVDFVEFFQAASFGPGIAPDDLAPSASLATSGFIGVVTFR
jgi:hypothetical protein